MTAAGEAGVGDPLAALPLPPWHPDPLRAAAAAQRAAAAELGGVAQRQAGAVAGTVGSAWIGAAAASCGEQGRRLAGAHDAAARHSEAAALALDACAAAWEQARDGYQRARHIADEAMREEQAQRAAGPAGLVAGPSTSPLRTRAVALASRAIDEFQLAARRAATELDVHTHVLAPAQPPPPPPRHHAKPWYQGAFGWLGDRGQELAGAGRSLLGFGGYAATHPGQTAGIVADIGGMAVGLLGMAAGAGGEAGGAVLDATGIGLPIGIPVNVASAGLIATGATVAGVSAVKANHDLGTMWAEAQSESSGGAEPEGGGASTGGIRPSAQPDFSDPAQPPGPGWEWRGSGSAGSSQGNWHNPNTGESLHPDLGHSEPIGPHYDYKAPDGSSYRVFPDGRVVPK